VASDTTGPTLDPKIARKLQRDNGLTRRLQSKLGADVDLEQAAAGFRNLGQFVAAVNNAKDADQFWQLKALMTGWTLDAEGNQVPTGEPTMSLGQAKQKLGIADDDPDSPESGTTSTSLSTSTSTSVSSPGTSTSTSSTASTSSTTSVKDRSSKNRKGRAGSSR
jgi:hypothetical protein